MTDTLRSFFMRLRHANPVTTPQIMWIDDEEPGVIRYGMRDVFSGKKYLVRIEEITEEEL